MLYLVTDVGGHHKEIVTLHKRASPAREAFFMYEKLKHIMKNIKDLRDDQIEVYNNLKSGKIGQSQAKELANVAGKVLSSCKIQMEYNKMVGDSKKKIKFLETDG